jgi:hypothetical protein
MSSCCNSRQAPSARQVQRHRTDGLQNLLLPLCSAGSRGTAGATTRTDGLSDLLLLQRSAATHGPAGATTEGLPGSMLASLSPSTQKKSPSPPPRPHHHHPPPHPYAHQTKPILPHLPFRVLYPGRRDDGRTSWLAAVVLGRPPRPGRRDNGRTSRLLAAGRERAGTGVDPTNWPCPCHWHRPSTQLPISTDSSPNTPDHGSLIALAHHHHHPPAPSGGPFSSPVGPLRILLLWP